MADDVKAPQDAPALSPSPADATPPAPQAGQEAAGYDPQWLRRLDDKRRADVEKFAEAYAGSVVKPLTVEIHSLKSQVGRAESAASPDVMARLDDEAAYMDIHRRTLTRLYGLSEEDAQRVKTPGELDVLLMVLKRDGANGSLQPGSEANPAMQAAWGGNETAPEAKREALGVGGGTTVGSAKSEFTRADLAAMTGDEYKTARAHLVK